MDKINKFGKTQRLVALRGARNKGFTLIELMIVVAIIGILASIALPSYADYITRSKLVEVTNELAAMRARMEQYYQDNRSYMAVVGSPSVYPCSNAETTTVSNRLTKSGFTVSCAAPAATASTYRVTATGTTGTVMAGASYTIDQDATRTSTAPQSWGTNTSCWIMAKSGC